MRNLLTLLLLTLTAVARPPNVIFILTDDQGWGDAKFAGHPYVKTPNLDRLAKEGTWLRQFYVAATVCSPSRTAFMTSHYPARHLVHGHFADRHHAPPLGNARPSAKERLALACPSGTKRRIPGVAAP